MASKTVRPKEFDGKSESVRKFLHKFELCAEINAWNDEATKLGQLSISLSDHAYDFFMRLPEGKRDTYTELKKSLLAEYDSPALKSDYALQLSGYKRRNGQSTAEYLNELQLLAERAYPEWDSAPREGLVKAQFVNGLDTELRTQLMLHAPEDEPLADLERRARRIEQVQTAASGQSASVRRVEEGPAVAEQVAELREQVSAVAASMSELQVSVGRLTSASGQQRSSGGRAQYRGSGRGMSNGNRDVMSARDACYHCGVSGHFARECRMRLRGRGRPCYRCGQPGHLARNCRVQMSFQ